MEQRQREAREKEEEIESESESESESERGNEIVKGRRRSAGQSEGGGGDRVSWPTWANNSSEMRVWLKGPPCT